MKVEILKKADKNFLEIWKSEWENSENGHFFNSPMWFLACVETFKIKNFLIVVVKKGKKIKLILPLVKKSLWSIESYANPGGRFLEKSSLLLLDKNPKIFSQMVRTLRNFGNIYLGHIDEDTASIFRGFPNFLIKHVSESPYLVVGDNPFRFMKKKAKSRIFAKYRKLKDDLTFVRHRENLLTHFKKVTKIDKNSWKNQKGYNDFATDENQKLLYKTLIKKYPENISIDILYYKNEAVVYSLAIIYKKTYQASQTGFLAQYKDLMPGKIRLVYLLDDLKNSYIEKFEMGSGFGMHKKEVTPFFTNYYDIFFSKNKLTLFWWKSIGILVDLLKGSSRLYRSICLSRKYLRDVRKVLVA